MVHAQWWTRRNTYATRAEMEAQNASHSEATKEESKLKTMMMDNKTMVVAVVVKTGKTAQTVLDRVLPQSQSLAD